MVMTIRTNCMAEGPIATGIYIITAKKDETEIKRFNFLGKSPTQPNKGITG